MTSNPFDDDPLERWLANMPQPEPAKRQRGLDTVEFDWDSWCDARIAAALAERDRAHLEGLGLALGEIRAQLRKEIHAAIGELRAEFSVLRSIDKSNVVIDMPSPLRRRRDVA